MEDSAQVSSDSLTIATTTHQNSQEQLGGVDIASSSLGGTEYGDPLESPSSSVRLQVDDGRALSTPLTATSAKYDNEEEASLMHLVAAVT